MGMFMWLPRRGGAKVTCSWAKHNQCLGAEAFAKQQPRKRSPQAGQLPRVCILAAKAAQHQLMRTRLLMLKSPLLSALLRRGSRRRCSWAHACRW